MDLIEVQPISRPLGWTKRVKTLFILFFLISISDQSPEFKEGVEKLSQLLRVPHHSDHLITLEACCKLIQKRFNAVSLKDPSKVVGKVRFERPIVRVPVTRVPLVFYKR